jgi:hypothetical protein
MSSTNSSVSAVFPAFPEVVGLAGDDIQCHCTRYSACGFCMEFVCHEFADEYLENLEALLDEAAYYDPDDPNDDDTSFYPKKKGMARGRGGGGGGGGAAAHKTADGGLENLEALLDEAAYGNPDDPKKKGIAQGGGGGAAHKAADEHAKLDPVQRMEKFVKQKIRLERERRATKVMAADRSAKAVMIAV